MLNRYRERASEESPARAGELAAAGDYYGEAVWRRTTDAIGQLANSTPPGPCIDGRTVPHNVVMGLSWGQADFDLWTEFAAQPFGGVR
jgi:hypothetical protein